MKSLREIDQFFTIFIKKMWQNLDQDTLNRISVSLDTPFQFLDSIEDLKHCYQNIKN